MVDWSPRANVKTVLFLRTGNYYRSRFAEELFNHEAERASLPWIAQSRGLALERGANNVGPIAPAKSTIAGCPSSASSRRPRDGSVVSSHGRVT
jgi:protein-tyrosine phosphatase